MNKVKKYILSNYKRIILLIMSIIFIMFAIRIKKSPELKIDDIVYNLIHSHTNEFRTNYFKLVSNLISGPVIMAVVVLSIILSYVKKNYKCLSYINYIENG